MLKDIYLIIYSYICVCKNNNKRKQGYQFVKLRVGEQ